MQSSILFAEMFKPDWANVVPGDRAINVGVDIVVTSDDFALRRSSLLTPPQAFAKGNARLDRSPRLTRRKRSARALKPTVLVVDDVADVTEMIALFLKHAGYEVTTADSATAALQLARESHYDLVISDIGMPEMTGYELATELRALSEYQGIPIIAVTGYSEYDDRSRALQAGFNAHLTKPIDPARLLDLMNELMG